MQLFNITSPFPSYIAVEGPIGSGATRLVNRLSSKVQGVRICLENDEPNPFLVDFYDDRERYAFQTETAFLINRFKQQESLRQGDLFTRLVLTDYLFDKSRLFSSLTLSDYEIAVFDRIFNLLLPQVTHPDMVIYLEAPTQLLEENLERYHYPYRDKISGEYLAGLCRIYYDFFRHFDSIPVLKINLEEESLDDDHAIESLIERISSLWQDHYHRHLPLTNNPLKRPRFP